MTRRQQKALRRSKAIKKKQNIDRIKNRAKSAAVVAGVTAVLSTPNISAQNAIDEIADVMIYTLVLSQQNNIDVSNSIKKKMEFTGYIKSLRKKLRFLRSKSRN